MRGVNVSRSFSRVSALAALFSAPAFANVSVVDASGGGNFTTIQTAVDAAADGDTILVKSGTYVGFSVGNKSLTIVGDTGATVQIQGAVNVSNQAAGKVFVLENVSATGISSTDANARYGLYLASDKGHIRVEDCQFVGAAIHPNGYEAIHIQSCFDVALTNTTCTGGSGAVRPEPFNAPSGAGLLASQSTVAIYDCSCSGGIGDSSDPHTPAQNGANGGDGCTAMWSTIFASDSSFIGGAGGGGGWGLFMSETYGGNGGDGIRLWGTSIARLLQVVTTPGNAGYAGNGKEGYPGEPGLPRDAAQGGTFADFAGQADHMLSVTPVRENSIIQMTFTGAVGDQVALLVADDANQVLIPTWKGTLLLKVQHPTWAVPMGTIPASGTLQVPWEVGSLNGLSSMLLHMQPEFISATQGHRKLGNPTSMVMLSQLY